MAVTISHDIAEEIESIVARAIKGARRAKQTVDEASEAAAHFADDVGREAKTKGRQAVRVGRAALTDHPLAIIAISASVAALTAAYVARRTR